MDLYSTKPFQKRNGEVNYLTYDSCAPVRLLLRPYAEVSSLACYHDGMHIEDSTMKLNRKPNRGAAGRAKHDE